MYIVAIWMEYSQIAHPPLPPPQYMFLFLLFLGVERFQANPARYMPGWGGFCAWGVSNESVWNKENLGPYSDPNAWVIEDDVLYVFRR